MIDSIVKASVSRILLAGPPFFLLKRAQCVGCCFYFISFIFVLRPRATLPARDVYYCNGTAAMLLIVAQVHVDRRGHTSRRAARMWSSSLLLLRPNQSLSLSPPLSPAFLNVLYIYFSPDINVELSRSPVSTHTHR